MTPKLKAFLFDRHYLIGISHAGHPYPNWPSHATASKTPIADLAALAGVPDDEMSAALAYGGYSISAKGLVNIASYAFKRVKKHELRHQPERSRRTAVELIGRWMLAQPGSVFHTPQPGSAHHEGPRARVPLQRVMDAPETRQALQTLTGEATPAHRTVVRRLRSAQGIACHVFTEGTPRRELCVWDETQKAFGHLA